MHAARIAKDGDPGEVEMRRAPNGEAKPFIDRNGYRRWPIDGKQVLEHRIVMEQMLGRPLISDENVHHINGVRHDNRPENLELWSTSQPPGQRVDDKLAWAVELIRRYSPELLADSDRRLSA
jgi:hypothetical protein